MVNEFATRVVSISSSIIRVCVGFLSTVCTSAIAAIALERGVFTISKSAAASSMRYFNSGPLGLLLLFWGGASWRRKLSTATFVFALFATSGLLQLTSTALLSDLKPGLVFSYFDIVQLPFRLIEDYDGITDISRTTHEQNYGANKPPFYPMFAEYAENPFLGEGVVDTGMTIRALLPLPSEQLRSLVRNYTGPATVFDSRVACIRPSVNITLFSPLGPGLYDGHVIRLSPEQCVSIKQFRKFIMSMAILYSNVLSSFRPKIPRENGPSISVA